MPVTAKEWRSEGVEVFWRGLEPPRHLVLFNWAGIRRALAGAGFPAIKRVARPGVYAALAAQSAAIRDGRDPALASDDRSWSSRLVTRLQALVTPERSEFVTLVATKPKA